MSGSKRYSPPRKRQRNGSGVILCICDNYLAFYRTGTHIVNTAFYGTYGESALGSAIIGTVLDVM